MDRHKKALIAGGGAALLFVVYFVYKRRSASATTASSPNGIVTNNNAAVAAQTLNPGIITITPGSGNNFQGNYGMDSNSSYALSLSEEAVLSKDLAAIASQPGRVGSAEAK